MQNYTRDHVHSIHSPLYSKSFYILDLRESLSPSTFLLYFLPFSNFCSKHFPFFHTNKIGTASIRKYTRTFLKFLSLPFPRVPRTDNKQYQSSLSLNRLHFISPSTFHFIFLDGHPYSIRTPVDSVLYLSCF